MVQKCDGKTVYKGAIYIRDEEKIVEAWFAPSMEDLEKFLKTNAKPDFTMKQDSKRTIDWNNCKCPAGCELVVWDNNTLSHNRQIALRRRLITAGHVVTLELLTTKTAWSEVALEYVCVSKVAEKKVTKRLPERASDRKLQYVYKDMRKKLLSNLSASIRKET